MANGTIVPDRFYEPGGLCAVVLDPRRADAGNACEPVFEALLALQHLGEGSVGVVSWNAGRQHCIGEKKLVQRYLTPAQLARVPGPVAVGHVGAYAVAQAAPNNVEPYLVETEGGEWSLAVTGRILNVDELRERAKLGGAQPHSGLASEALIALAAQSCKRTALESFTAAFGGAVGWYSALALASTDEGSWEVLAVRDPFGIGTLVLGRLPRGAGFVITRETRVLDILPADFIRELAPGEILRVSAEGMRSAQIERSAKEAAPCVFSCVHFLHPDSAVRGVSVHEIREAFGRRLAFEDVTQKRLPKTAGVEYLGGPLPDSGWPFALGYCQMLDLAFDSAIIRNHYAGQHVVEVVPGRAGFGTAVKWSVNRRVVEGKGVVVFNDSGVTGETARRITDMLRKKGAKEVHWRYGSPAIRHAGLCLPFPRERLVALKRTDEEMAHVIGAESVAHLSLPGMLDVLKELTGSRSFCTCRFDGRCPVDV